MKNITYTIIGLFFGYTLVTSQVVSWYRIQEMFLFDNFHMYGVIGTAIISAAIFIQIIKRLNIKSMNKSPIHINTKALNKGTVIGGSLFGLGWAITGACPGPIFALVGSTAWIYIIVLLSALVGVFIYGKTLAR